MSDNVTRRGLSFPEEAAGGGQEVGGLGYGKLPVCAESSSAVSWRLFYLPFDDVGVPFEPLAAMFYVARQPGNADSGETRGPIAARSTR